MRGESGLRPAPTQEGTTPTSAFSGSPGHPAFSSSEPQPAVDASGESRSPVLVSSWRGVGGKQHQQAPAPDGATLPLADCAPPLWEPVRRRGGDPARQQPAPPAAPPADPHRLVVGASPLAAAVLPAQEQRRAEQQDGHHGQGQDHQCGLHHLLQARGLESGRPGQPHARLGPHDSGGVGGGGPGSLPSAPPPRPLTKRGHRSVRNPQRERAAGSRHPLGTAPAGSLTPWTSLSQSQARIPVSQMRTLQF